MNLKPSVGLYFDKRRLYKDEKYPVRIRVIFDRKPKQYSTGISLTEDDFEKIKSGKNLGYLKDIHSLLNALLFRYEEAIKQTVPFSFSTMEKNLGSSNRGARENVFDLFEVKIAKLENENTKASYRNAVKFFKGFYKKEKLAFHEVTVESLNELAKKETAKGISIATVNIYMRYLRHIFKIAIKERYIDESYFPFGKGNYEISSSVKRKKALNQNQLKALFLYKPKEGSRNEKALDFWTFSFLSNGMNMADIAHLKWKQIDGDTFTFIRKKSSTTKQQVTEIIVHLNEKHWEIMERQSRTFGEKSPDDYIFPILDKGMDQKKIIDRIHDQRRIVSKGIKVIAKEQGLDMKVAFENARHSFASALKFRNVSVSVMKDFLGHSSNRSLEHYISTIDTDGNRKISEDVYRSVFGQA